MTPSCDFLVMLDRMAEKGIVPAGLTAGLTAGQRASMIAHGMIKLADPKTRVKSSDFRNKAKMVERITREAVKEREWEKEDDFGKNSETQKNNETMKNKTEKPDSRPRFGWCRDLDYDPQWIYEKKSISFYPVAVIPLPCMSAVLRKKIREFTNGTIWPKP